MQVVLIKRVPKLGEEHDVVKVKRGFARNFLIPQGLAVIATEEKKRLAEKLRAQRVQKVEAKMENIHEIAEQLKGITLTFAKKTRGEKLYGSVGEKDILPALKEHKIELAKGMITSDPIKELGEHTVTIQLSDDVKTELKVVIEKEGGKK